MGIAIPQIITPDSASGAQVIDGSLKFNETVSGANSLSKTFGSAGNRNTITWSAWVRRAKISGESNLFSVGDSSTDASFRFNADDTLQVRDGAGGELTTSAAFRDTGWYHIVVKIDTTQSTAADRFRLYVNGSETVYGAASYASEDADIDWNDAVNHYIGRQVHNTSNLHDGAICQVYFIDGQALGPENFGFTDPLTNTWKPKKYKVALAETVTVQPSYVSKNNVLDEANAFDGSNATEATYQGVGSWLSFTVDASNLTVPFRIRNDSSGTGQTVAMFTDSSGSSAAGGTWASTGANTLSPAISTTVDDTYTFPSAGTYYLRHTVGSDSNIFVYRIGGDITTGGNSFYLPMDNEDDFEKDKSGNGNDWTKNNFSGTSNDPDVLPDSPSGISYSTDSSSGITTTSQIKPTTWVTMNPLTSVDSGVTFSDGNLNTTNKGSTYDNPRATASVPSSGKYYWEVEITEFAGGFHVGLSVPEYVNSSYLGAKRGEWAYGDSGQKYDQGSSGSYGSSFTSVGKVISCAFDADAGTVTFYNDGVSQGIAFTGLTNGPYLPAMYARVANTGGTWNFGQKPFKYTPPDGYQGLCAANTRPDKVISRPDQYVGVTTYTGDGNTGRNIRTLQFKPDLVWIKQTSDTRAHALFDTVRGANKRLQSSSTNVETTHTDQMSAFIDNGFTVEDNNTVNVDTGKYVAWCWKAGGDKNTYNIDNVGYSTSVDVGFDAGGLNDVAYNSSRTWSSNMVTTGNSGNWHASYPVTNAFNGNHTNYAHGNADGSVSATVTLTFNPAIACEENVTFMGGFTNTTAGTGTISINGGQTIGVTTCRGNDPAATDLTVVPFTGDISTIVINKTSGGAQGMILYGFKIDGVELLDNGVTPTYNYPTAPSTGCSVGTKQGFSIVSYTGNSTNPSTHAHGLLKAPRFVIIKNRDRSSNGEWIVGHADAVGNQLEKDHRDYGGFKEGHQLYLNSANAVDGGSSNWFSNSRPDRFTFTVKDNYQVNYAGDDYIAYLWHDVPGLQKFGYYIGNGSSNGIYVELGFRPALLWIKNAFTGNETWCAHDDQRDTFNPAKRRLSLESTGGQDASQAARNKDFLSNGFKIRGTSGEHNTNGDRYIYCAWAEAPTIDLFGGGANAR